MRIGLVTDFYYPWIAGPGVLLRNLGHHLTCRGHAVSLLAPSPTGEPYSEWDGEMQVRRVRTVGSPVGYGLRVAPPLGGEIGRWMDEFRPEVVHVHHPFPISARAISSSRRRGIPVVATNHTVPSCSLWGLRTRDIAYRGAHYLFGSYIVFLLNRCHAVATPTATAAAELRALGFRRDIAVISNGVDLHRFSPRRADVELRTRLHLDDRPIVLYTGRLDADKAMDVWLRAAARLTDLNVQFVVGGKGADRARLEAMTVELGLNDRVRFIGYLDEEEYPRLYNLASVYCITSPVELQSITTLEAVASGVPVVAVRAGALSELVHDGENGHCVPPGDDAAVAQGLRGILTDSVQREEFGRNGRMIARGHDLRESMEAYERFLQDAGQIGLGAHIREQAATVGS